jgi:hypothetical protein
VVPEPGSQRPGFQLSFVRTASVRGRKRMRLCSALPVRIALLLVMILPPKVGAQEPAAAQQPAGLQSFATLVK